MPYKKQMPENPNTLGKHILRKRLELRLLQRDVAAQIGVVEMVVTNWEVGRSTPQMHLYPAIVAFLGYYPFDRDISTVRGQIKFIRYSKGWSLERMAEEFDVHSTTLRDWFLNDGIYRKAHRRILSELLQQCLSM